MGNAQSPPSDPRFNSACRSFTPKKLEDLKSLFASLASQSQSNGRYITRDVFQAYFGLKGSLGQRMFDLITQQRKDDKLTYEDLVIAKATYEKGTNDEIDEFIYQLLDVNNNGILERSDLESVMKTVFSSLFSTATSQSQSDTYEGTVDVFIDAATFSKGDNSAEKGMSFEDFRHWCSLIPSVRKFLGSLLVHPHPGRPGYQVPQLLYPEDINPSILLLTKEYAWHIGGALRQQELEEWELLYHSSLNGSSYNTFLGNISKTEDSTVLIIKDKEGYIYGGYASQPWEKHGGFYGDMKSFLFQLNPKASIFRPTGANTNIQWCAVGFSSESIPNGMGFGGQANHFGLFISGNFDQGHTFSSPTFGNPCLSKTSRIYPETIECWGVVLNGKHQEKHEGLKGTVLDRFKEDRNMLNMVGIAGNSN